MEKGFEVYSRQRQGAPEHHHLPIPESIAKEPPTANPLSAYMVRPKVHFETQDQEEKIVLLLRAHLVTNIPWLVTVFVLLLVPLLFTFTPLSGAFPMRFQAALIVMWYLLTIAYAFGRFLFWYYNVYIITDERIVDVDFHSLLYKEVSETKIDNIQDVTFMTGGFLRSMLNFGTVIIQTAGEQLQFEFGDVPHPDRVVKVLNELLLEEEQEKLEGRAR